MSKQYKYKGIFEGDGGKVTYLAIDASSEIVASKVCQEHAKENNLLWLDLKENK